MERGITYQSELGEKIKKAASTPDRSRLHVIAGIGGHWVLRREGALKAIKRYRAKNEAIKGALSTVKKGEVKAIIIHKKDGTIESVKEF